MTTRGRWMTATGVALVLAGCAKEKPAPPPPAPAAQAPAAQAPAKRDRHGRTTTTAASAGHATTASLDQVRPGMRATEVQDILGRPDSERSFETGKRWIPWYFGPDVRRTVWYYRGVGRVSFDGGNVWGAGGGTVHHVDADPNEPGTGVHVH